MLSSFPGIQPYEQQLPLVLGIGVPVRQHLNGNQSDYNFLVTGNVG